jgi:hypothetical protein
MLLKPINLSIIQQFVFAAPEFLVQNSNGEKVKQKKIEFRSIEARFYCFSVVLYFNMALMPVLNQYRIFA